MRVERTSFEKELTKQIVSTFADEARKQGVTTIQDIYYKTAMIPEILAVLSSSRAERLPGSGTPQEVDFRRIKGIRSRVLERFKTESQDPFKFRVVSAGDIREGFDEGVAKLGFEKLPFTPKAA